MEKLYKILNWPENKKTGLYPLWKIIWNAIWIGPIYLFSFLLVAVVFLKDGPKTAKYIWESIL